MDAELFTLMNARRGHFVLESGHHGELWLDVDRLFTQPAKLRPFVDGLSQALAPYAFDVVCGPMTGGALLGLMVAQEVGREFVYAQRAETVSNDLFPVAYPIPLELAAVVRGRRVAIVNDVTNAGSAVRCAVLSLLELGAEPVVIATLLSLGDAPERLAADFQLPLVSLAASPNRIWTASGCPLCAAGKPLEEAA